MKAVQEPSGLNPLERLQTQNHSQLLDVIDKLRAQGVSNFLPLPQLIVCGDQSSGKSSVLEAICGVPFPKKDNLCTRFATEVILRRNADVEQIEAHVSIRPGKDRSEVDQKNLANFAQALPDVQDLPRAIQRAKDAMGLGSQGGNAFSTDVLRLEITGRTMPQLTIVDLPGLIHSENKFQTAQDVELVSRLVQSYMAQSRSIILAVVSAKNDYANQIILQRARETDPMGQRTLGIITKPDTLHAGSDSERAFLGLARNTDVAFKLGWHVVRNLDTNDARHDAVSRDDLEEDFFKHSSWKTLPRSSLGITSLRSRLSEVLFGQITRELPHLMEEIEVYKDDCQSALHRLGRTRESEQDQRLYLAELNQKVHDICRAGCDGLYDHAFFRETDGSLQPIEFRRVRAAIQNHSMAFRRKVELTGSRWQLSENSEPTKGRLTREDAINRVVDLLKRSRGRELPGTFNPLLISELFHEYSSPWEALSKQYVTEIWQLTSQFLDAILRYLTDDSVFDNYTRLLVGPAMDEVLMKAYKALTALLEERTRHATTYNPYFTQNFATQRNDRSRETIERKLRSLLTEGSMKINEAQISWLVRSLAEESESDMDRAAAQDIFERMQAYYQVALRRLTDNIPIHVIESVIVHELQSVIEPIHAWKMKAQLVQDIAGESAAMRFHREQLTEKLGILTKGETICKRYATQSEDAVENSEDHEIGSQTDRPATPRSSYSIESTSQETKPDIIGSATSITPRRRVPVVRVPQVAEEEPVPAEEVHMLVEEEPVPAEVTNDEFWGFQRLSTSNSEEKMKKKKKKRAAMAELEEAPPTLQAEVDSAWPE